MKKRLVASILTVFMVVSVFTGCSGKGGNSTAASGDNTASASDFKVAMVTDTGGINDQSFNQSSWEGLEQFSKDNKSTVKYLESKQASDYATNLDKLADEGNNMIWGIGYAMADAIIEAAKSNPDVSYAIIDNSYEDTPSNVTGVTFRAQESSFLVGYIAGKTTKTNKVGFVGGQTSAVIDQFQYGYQAGVDYAAKELGKKIDVSVQYADSFSDSAKGKAIASKMFTDGCDIVFHAAGGAGTGVIAAAKDAGKWAIGVDRDQSSLAPDNVLTSALKRVDIATQLVTKDKLDGKEIGGKTYDYGMSEGCVGIPATNKNMSEDVYNAAMNVQKKIVDGTITPPYNSETYKAFNP